MGDLIKPHEPYLLENGMKAKAMTRNIVEAIEDGLPVEDAFKAEGITYRTYRRWFKEAMEDIENGFTGTHLITLFLAVIKADTKLFRKYSKKMFELADEGDTRMLMYLADNRFGYANKRKQKVELDTVEDTAIEINIVEMTPIDEEEEEVIEVERTSGDDTNPKALD